MRRSISSSTKSMIVPRRTVQIPLLLPTQLMDTIDERAKGLGISRAALIKQASALFLENNK